MFSRQAIIKSIVAAAILFSFLGISPRSAAQGLQQKLESTYALTKPTDDKIRHCHRRRRFDIAKR
jgi:hypothetical protein